VKSPLEIGILPHFGDREVHDGFPGIDFLSEFKYLIDYQNNLLYRQRETDTLYISNSLLRV
jgi:hypothetical protein